jgi:8-oxo-dGTP diphosphatase
MSNQSALQPREIACAVIIDTRGRLLLQQRDNIVGILHPGKVGLFGGHREGHESFLECVVREIHEELSYFVPAEMFEFLTRFEGADLDVPGGAVRGDFFVTRNIPAEALTITEGSMLIVNQHQVRDIETNLTPSARFALNAFFKRS